MPKQLQGIPKKEVTGATYTQFLQEGKGLHCGAKTFPHLLLAAAITSSDVKLFEKGPSDSFDFYQELFLGQQQTLIRLIPSYG